MTKQEAATSLGISVRSLERYTSAGRITAGQKRGKTGMMLDYLESEVEKLRQDLASVDGIIVDDSPVGERGGNGRSTDSADSRRDTSLDRLIGPSNGDTSTATSQTALATLEPQAQSHLEVIDAPTSTVLVKASPEVTGYATDLRQVASKLLWSLDEASLLTGVSKGQLREAIGAKQLKAVKVGRPYFVRPQDLKAWIDSLFEG